MEENTPSIPITRPQTQVGPPPEVLKVLQREGKSTSQRQQSYSDTQGDIPDQFIEKSKYPTVQVNLISEGVLYPENHPLSSGVVELKQVTAFQEDILSNESYIKKGTVLTKLLESLLINKKIKVTDFLVCDLNGIYITIRRMAYGDEYPVKVKCPSCQTENILKVDLSTIQPKPMDYSKFQKGVNAFEFELPTSKNRIAFKILTQKEDEIIESEIKALTRINKEKSADLTTRLKHVIISIDGEDDKGYIKKFIETELLAKDSLALRRHIKEVSPEIPMETSFSCPNCDYQDERMVVPLTLSFFWPNT